MGAPFTTEYSVADAARRVIEAAGRMERQRLHADMAVATMEARWAANRARRHLPIEGEASADA